MDRPYFITDFEIVSLFMSLSIAFYVYTKYSIKSVRNYQFKRLVISIIFYSFADIFCFNSVNLNAPMIVRYIGQSLFLTASVFEPFAVLCYTFSYTIPERKNPLNSKKSLLIFFAFFTVLFVVNFWTEFIFSFDNRTALVKGKGFGILQAFATLCSFVCFIFFIVHHSDFTKLQLLTLNLFTFGTMIIPFVQAIFVLYRFIAFVFCVFLMLLLLVIESPDEQALIETINELEEWEEKLKSQVAEKTREAEDKAKKLERLTMQMMYALAEIIDAKDTYTSGHSSRVARYSKMLAQKRGLSEEECNDIFMMGILHDIGKVGLPSKIINKTGPLAENELSIIRRHPEIGAEILKNVTMLPKLQAGARWHHEQINGLGYPDGLSGNEIPLEVKIIAVADAYDAMTSYRSYRSVMSQDQVRKEFANESGSHFDPEIVRLMFELIDEDKDYKMHEYRKSELSNVV